MKMLFLVTDSEYEQKCFNMMKEKGIAGFTVIPNIFGVGRSGVRMGDRYHPGASILLLSAIEDDKVEDVLGCIKSCIQTKKLCESTHAWVLPVEKEIK